MKALWLAVLSMALCAPVLRAAGWDDLRQDDGEWTAAKLEGISDVVCQAKIVSMNLSDRRSRNDHVPTRQMVVKLEPVTVYKGEPRAEMEFRYWTPDPDAKRENPWPKMVQVETGKTYILYLKDNTEYYYNKLLKNPTSPYDWPSPRARGRWRRR